MKRLLTTIKQVTTDSLRKRPLVTFAASLILLLAVIVLANFIRNPKTGSEQTAKEPVAVTTYNIGTAPLSTVQGRVEKSGVITIVAQSSGVVRHIAVKPGDSVTQGKTVVSLASNYHGANVASVQRQIAQKNYQLSTDTLEQQRQLIEKQKRELELGDERDEELAELDADRADETEELLDINEEMLDQINSNLDELEELQTSSPSAEVDDLLQGVRASRAMQLSAVFGLKQQLRSLEYQLDEEEDPTQLRHLSKEIALQRLDVNEKTLQLNHEVARLNYKVALISESLMYPAAPFAGTVERVHVAVGEVVNPGDPLLTFSGNSQNLTVVATVPEKLARNISPYDAATLKLNGDEYSTVPLHISKEPTHGSLFSIIYSLPDEFAHSLSDNSLVSISIPIGFADTTGAVPAVPIDIIHQLQDDSFVYVVVDGKAVAREVRLGEIYGSQVQILDGLNSDETVIINRNVIEGDEVTVL